MDTLTKSHCGEKLARRNFACGLVVGEGEVKLTILVDRTLFDD